MEVYIGKIVNTHGIKGEVRIISDFKYKNLVFKPGVNIYVGKKREKLTIATYRTHKNYDMVTFNGINDINDVLCYKGDSVFINREDIKIDGYVNEDIINLEVYSKQKLIGHVTSIVNNGDAIGSVIVISTDVPITDVEDKMTTILSKLLSNSLPE